MTKQDSCIFYSCHFFVICEKHKPLNDLLNKRRFPLHFNISLILLKLKGLSSDGQQYQQNKQ